MAVTVCKTSKAGVLSGIGVLSIAVNILAGERMNTLLKYICILASFIWKPKFFLISVLIFIQFLAVLTMSFSSPDIKTRFVEELIHKMPIFNTRVKMNIGMWRGGIQQGLITPVIGIGPFGTKNVQI